LIIQERRSQGETVSHRLKGVSGAVYLFCETRRRVAEIVDRFPRFGDERIRPLLRMMMDKWLMFCERDFYPALAVSEDPLRSAGLKGPKSGLTMNNDIDILTF